MDNWIPCAEQLPPQGKTVLTKIHDEDGCRNEQLLKFYNNLWWFEDYYMYVYYRPTHWQPLHEKGNK